MHDYPDQNMLSHLLEGVRFEADVELQTVLVPHLISLPLGFASVRKELYRLEKNGSLSRTELVRPSGPAGSNS